MRSRRSASSAAIVPLLRSPSPWTPIVGPRLLLVLDGVCVSECCAGGVEARRPRRARLWELRTMAGADIKYAPLPAEPKTLPHAPSDGLGLDLVRSRFSRGGPTNLKPEIQARMKSLGWSGRDVRMPFNTVCRSPAEATQ